MRHRDGVAHSQRGGREAIERDKQAAEKDRQQQDQDRGAQGDEQRIAQILVVFPHPLGPIMPRIEPSGTV